MTRGRAKALKDKDPFAVALGARIKQAREALDYTQKKLGLEAKYDPIQLSRVESGDAVPRSDALARIAAALQTPVSVLFGEDASTLPAASAGTARPSRNPWPSIGALQDQVELVIDLMVRLYPEHQDELRPESPSGRTPRGKRAS